MANLLVTGGAGFIGANFVRHHRQGAPGDGIIVLDLLTYAGHRANLDGVEDVLLVEGDILDTPLVSRLLADYAIDTVVHFAAESHVDRSIAGPDAFIQTNVVGTHSLLQAAKAVWLDSGSGKPHRFHHVSTDEVYGSLGPHEPPFTETTAYAPNSPYSASKAASDHLVRAYHRTYGLDATTSQCSNNYGPFQHPEKLIPLVIVHALTGKPIPIFGDGLNVRDWLHVEDHCRGIEACLAKGRTGETYAIGGGEERPNLWVIAEICRAIDEAFAADPALHSRFPHAPAAQDGRSEDLKTFVTDRKGHDRRYALNDAKARSELAYAPLHNFSEGIAETVAWYLDREDWWRPLLRARAPLD